VKAQAAHFDEFVDDSWHGWCPGVLASGIEPPRRQDAKGEGTSRKTISWQDERGKCGIGAEGAEGPLLSRLRLSAWRNLQSARERAPIHIIVDARAGFEWPFRADSAFVFVLFALGALATWRFNPLSSTTQGSQ
jgi:hypothetical protein